MPQLVEVPGLGRLQFPDGMGDAEMSAAIRRLMQQQPQPQTAQPASGAQSMAGETGRMQAFGVAAGKKTDSILDGITQMYLGARGEDSALAGLKQNVEEKESLYRPLRDKYPFVTGAGEAVPMLATGAGGIVRSAVGGAVPELLSYGTTEDRLKRGAVGAAGGAIGGAIGQGAGRLLKPAGQGAAGISDDAARAAERVGFRLSPGQTSQNPAMQAFENYLARSPGSSGAMQAGAAANQTALNRAAAGAMGQRADDLSEGVFMTAKDRIGAEFGRLQGVTAPKLGDNFLDAVANVDAQNAARGSFKSAKIDELIDQSLDLAARGKLTGTAYKEIRTEISSKATAAFKAGDATLGRAYKDIRKALDEAAEQSLSAADKKAWATTRAQYQAYKTLTKSNVAEAGNVSAARLAGGVRRQGDGLRTGAANGPLADIARIGEAVKGVPNPTSGQLNQQMLYGNPFTGVPLLLGNKAAGSLYNSPLLQKYMAQGLIDIGPNGQLILGTAARPIGLPLARQYLGAE